MNARTTTTYMATSSTVRVPVEATDCSTANVDTIIISSITVTPKRRDETSVFAIPNSCKTRDNTTVLVTEIARAIKRLSNRDIPIICPTTKPNPKVPKASEKAITRRSEEHTSELQSRQYLVCRLLLEKKKKKQTY